VSSDGPKWYIAAFNWNSSATVTLTVDLARAGLDPTATYAVRDLWTGTRTTASGTLAVTLAKAASTIYELER
jgi:hypothetical protein